MTNRKAPSSQLLIQLLQTLIPLVVAGGFTGILSIFKEDLPPSFYQIFLYITWYTVSAMLIFLVLRLILGNYPRKLINWIRKIREQRADKQLIKNWESMFWELGLLIEEVKEAGWEATDKHVETYAKIHSWFIKHRTNFLPWYNRFQTSRTRPAHKDSGSTTDLSHKVFHNNYDDPYSYFYAPLSLRELITILEHWSGGEILYTLRELLDRTEELIEWFNSG